MDNAGYVALSRQTGLLQELTALANNVANAATTGYRREKVVFAEVVQALDAEGGSIAQSSPVGRLSDPSPGPMRQTGGVFDLAIEGVGFFAAEGSNGPILTRAGAFKATPDGALVTADGRALLNSGGGPVFAPVEAEFIAITPDGSVVADGQPVDQIGVFLGDPAKMERRAGAGFAANGPLEPVLEPRIRQGFLEGSNVNSVVEIARLIEVQHAYELGQGLLDREDERVRAVLRTLGEPR